MKLFGVKFRKKRKEQKKQYQVEKSDEQKSYIQK